MQGFKTLFCVLEYGVCTLYLKCQEIDLEKNYLKGNRDPKVKYLLLQANILHTISID